MEELDGLEEGEIIEANMCKPQESKRFKGICVKNKVASVVIKSVCKFWMEGKCKKRDDCPFSHDATPRKTENQVLMESICKFGLRNACLKGSECRFSHDFERVPCRFFHFYRGCKARLECRFSHEPMKDQEEKDVWFREWEKYQKCKDSDEGELIDIQEDLGE
jgi:hypothetical protein